MPRSAECLAMAGRVTKKRPAKHPAATRVARRTTAYTLTPPGPAVANTGTWTPISLPLLAKVTAATSSVSRAAVLCRLQCVVPVLVTAVVPRLQGRLQADFRPTARVSGPRSGMADSGRKAAPNAVAMATMAAKPLYRPSLIRRAEPRWPAPCASDPASSPAPCADVSPVGAVPR